MADENKELEEIKTDVKTEVDKNDKKAKTTKTTKITDKEDTAKSTDKERQTVNFSYPKDCTISRGKQAYLSSKKYVSYRDILTAMLDENGQYTENEVVEIIEGYLNGGIK